MNGAVNKVILMRNGAKILWTAYATTNVLAPDATSFDIVELVELIPMYSNIATMSNPL